MIYLTEEMFSAGRPISQGEVNIWMKKYAPKAVIDRLARLKKITEFKSDGRHLTVGHSETGHHHVLEPVENDVPISRAALMLIDAANSTFVELRLAATCRLTHLKSADAHETLVLPPGEYIRGIREEQAPEGWRQVSD